MLSAADRLIVVLTALFAIMVFTGTVLAQSAKPRRVTLYVPIEIKELASTTAGIEVVCRLHSASQKHRRDFYDGTRAKMVSKVSIDAKSVDKTSGYRKTLRMDIVVPGRVPLTEVTEYDCELLALAKSGSGPSKPLRKNPKDSWDLKDAYRVSIGTSDRSDTGRQKNWTLFNPAGTNQLPNPLEQGQGGTQQITNPTLPQNKLKN